MDLAPYSRELYDSLGALVTDSPAAAWFTLQAEVMRMLVPLADQILENLRLETLMYSRYKPILDEIGPEPDASLRVSDLADAMQMALPSLSRGFKRDFGIPLKQFLSERVNQRACDLLLATDASASSVSRELGFHDPLYFYRFFRRMNGMTPSEFRRSVVPRSIRALSPR
jgi:AraC-like DNA-binding protein